MSNFATCCYHQFRPEMGIPVRTSAGTPRFPLRYELRHAIPQLAPTWATRQLDYVDFRRAYRHQLHRFTIDRVLAAAYDIRQAEGVDDEVPLVLLCFENLAKPDQWCHRTFLAEWLEAKGQGEVMEFGDLLVAQPVPLPPAPAPAVAQLDLFAAA